MSFRYDVCVIVGGENGPNGLLTYQLHVFILALHAIKVYIT